VASDQPSSKKTGDDAGLLSRVLRAFGILFGVHLQFAQREAKSDLGRILSGFVCVAVAVLLLLCAAGLGHGAAVVWVHDTKHLPWGSSIGVVAGGDALLAVFLLLIGRARLRRPILKETRGLVRRTVSALTE
jgi:hypothetical protein